MKAEIQPSAPRILRVDIGDGIWAILEREAARRSTIVRRVTVSELVRLAVVSTFGSNPAEDGTLSDSLTELIQGEQSST